MEQAPPPPPPQRRRRRHGNGDNEDAHAQDHENDHNRDYNDRDHDVWTMTELTTITPMIAMMTIVANAMLYVQELLPQLLLRGCYTGAPAPASALAVAAAAAATAAAAAAAAAGFLLPSVAHDPLKH